MTDPVEPALVPELLVADLDRSLEFWCGPCGFTIRYSRMDERFAYVTRGSAHLMLEQAGVGRNWVTGSLDRPLGRGVNLQITVADSESLSAAFADAGVDLFMPLETTWYRVGGEEAGVRQFLVQDPDGYLIRFQSSAGRRRIEETSSVGVQAVPADADGIRS
ncbi:VOC family protein [Microbacterium sp. 1P10UB]|uniref:bleomycin resistance protein n=1 Tax=unclassified Microbacterium TaxID=2609290 RepID=UPI0039A15A94